MAKAKKRGGPLGPYVGVKESNRRLLLLANKLDSLPRARFDFGRWVGPKWQGKADLSCGATACAIGWATTMPVFRLLGLRLNAAGYPVLKGPEVWENAGMKAITGIFGVSNDEAGRLFLPADFRQEPDKLSRRATPKQVAKHIRKFVETRS